MPILRFVKPELKLSSSVAIIGSSADIKQQKAATDIDSFDDVLRFNRAPTEGWEKVVGAKTTCRIVNGHVFRNVKFKRWKEDNDFVKNLRNTKIIVASPDFARHEANQHTDTSNDVYILEFYKLIRILNKTFGCAVVHPTVGFVGIAAVVLSGIKPQVYGWSGSSVSHYYNDRGAPSKVHKFFDEWEIIKKLHSSGKLILH